MNEFDRLALPASLASPGAYAWSPPAVEVIETHISWVFLAGDFVLKVKRPVDFGFVDHTTAARRRHSCEEEIRLNQRLTEGVYLRVVPITIGQGGPLVDGPGEPVEWGTLMRRLPADRMLDRLIAARSIPGDLAERLARRLIPFHRGVAGDCGASAGPDAGTVIRVVTDNLHELEAFSGVVLPGTQLRLVRDVMHRYLAGNRRSFDQRMNQGLIRDGHGDLRCEHVCLEGDTVQIFDCVEFNPGIRCADVASDLAFLLMDLERLGCRQIARDLERRYRAAELDLPPALVNFYRAHRALVRAKVGCLTLASDRGERAEKLAGEARSYLHLATRFATTAAPALIVMTGLSGSGKSTLARDIGLFLGATVHASDVVRKALAGIDGAAPSAWMTGIYDADWSQRTYARLAELATADLADGKPTVLDAAFLTSEERAIAARAAGSAGVPLILVETLCDPAIVEERLRQRTTERRSLSDAGVEIYRRQVAALAEQPPAAPSNARHVRVDTGADPATWTERVFEALVQSGVLSGIISDVE